ncbi:MAG TPA: hypothetical protein VJC18_03045, partial [bacterium]|nr:hypothetical protein [bacterium]
MFITNPLLTKLLPHMNHGSPSVTLTGIADTQSLNAFVESVSSFSSARAEHPFPDDPIKFRAQWSLVKTHHICGGVPLNFQNVEELLAWRKEGRFVVPEQFENTRNDERGALSSIRSQFTDPDICALHISLFNAGFLIQETRPSAERNIGQWHVRELVDLREGLEVVELLDAHTQGTAYDIMDLIASVDWGDFRPYGLKNINASLSSLSEFKNPHYRHSNGEEETTIITKKCHCVAHVFMGRLTVLWGKTQMLSFQTPPYRQPSAIKHIAAIQARLRYHSFARLAVEIAVANKLKASGLPHYAFIDDTSFDCMLNAIYHMGFDDMTQLSREDYIALHKKTFEALWTKTSISHEHTLTRIQDMLTLPLSGTAQSHAENTLDTIARKISEDIREMRSDRACI